MGGPCVSVAGHGRVREVLSRAEITCSATLSAFPQTPIAAWVVPGSGHDGPAAHADAAAAAEKLWVVLVAVAHRFSASHCSLHRYEATVRSISYGACVTDQGVLCKGDGETGSHREYCAPDWQWS